MIFDVLVVEVKMVVQTKRSLPESKVGKQTAESSSGFLVARWVSIIYPSGIERFDASAGPPPSNGGRRRRETVDKYEVGTKVAVLPR